MQLFFIILSANLFSFSFVIWAYFIASAIVKKRKIKRFSIFLDKMKGDM